MLVQAWPVFLSFFFFKALPTPPPRPSQNAELFYGIHGIPSYSQSFSTSEPLSITIGFVLFWFVYILECPISGIP